MVEITRQKLDRRTLLAGSVAAAALIRFGTDAVMAQDPRSDSDQERIARRARFEELGYLWRATSPSIHLGDTFTAVITNRGQSEVTIWPSIIIMDHAKHHNESVVDEEVTLPAGGEQIFTGVNDYGVANHFSTRMLASTGDPATLGIDISIVDSTGVQTTQFNERAFMVQSWEDVAEMQAELESDMSDDGAHHH